VYSIAGAMADTHLQAREAFVKLQHPELGPVPAPAVVPRFARRAAPISTEGPSTGQHNAQVYGALGLDQEALERLRHGQIVQGGYGATSSIQLNSNVLFRRRRTRQPE